MAEVSSTAIVKYSAQAVLPYFKLQQVDKISISISISYAIKGNYERKSSKLISIYFFLMVEFLKRGQDIVDSACYKSLIAFKNLSSKLFLFPSTLVLSTFQDEG